MGFFGDTQNESRTQNHLEGAKKEWNRLRDAYYGNEAEGIAQDPSLQIGDMVVGDPYTTDPRMQRAYQAGAQQQANTSKWLSPEDAAALGMQAGSTAWMDGGSSWANEQSAYDALGPSSWSGYQSAYEGMGPSSYAQLGPSAYGDLAYDSGALEGLDASAGYYRNLMTGGSDPIAEADYARRTAQAEASRRANTDAALAQLEQRGQGNANAGLLAELSNQQASVSDQYLAGLGAQAMAAARRDAAAGSAADIAAQRGQGMLAADTARAGGLDQYGMQRAAGQDQYAQARAAGLDTAGAAQAAGLDQYGMQRAGGADTYATSKQNALDDFAMNRMKMADDWANKQYDRYYQNQQFNAGQYEHANDRNMDRQWGAGDANTDLWNQSAYYNNMTAPQSRFDQRGALAAGGANVRLGAASGYGALARDQNATDAMWFNTGKDVLAGAAKKAEDKGYW